MKQKFSIIVVNLNGEQVIHQSVVAVTDAKELAKHIHAIARTVERLSVEETPQVQRGVAGH